MSKFKILDDGLLINKVRASFGVIGVIYEARPNVTSDVSINNLIFSDEKLNEFNTNYKFKMEVEGCSKNI